MNLKKQLSIIILLFAFNAVIVASHPGIFLTPKGIREIRSSLAKLPAFNKAFQEMKSMADAALLSEIVVPQPVDAGGGYTHEKHKRNYYEMNAAGVVYQITKDKRYAEFVKNMLFEYARMYPTLDLHPVIRSRTRGRIFWQALNEAVWLVHVSRAYDYIYNYLSPKEREFIEKNLFYPMAEFLSNGNQANYEVFNMMHNHGTWATAAVGMIGYVMDDNNLTQMALYGSNKDGKTGFIRQLDYLFSPDGYYTEGPYYQRYSIWPFMTFAQVIQNKQPELKIFEYRDGILLKAVDILLQSSYQGQIFYLNNSLSKTLKTQEIVYAVNIAFANNPSNRSLLDIARWQNTFVVSDAGLATARALARSRNIPSFQFRSLLMRDGYDGSKGGIAVFRSGSGDNEACLTFKATSHGLAHGHYDKLSITLHDNGHAILTDYGAVRFLNIAPKFGGHYARENFTWAMQTIAHNTVTVDSTSHFNADIVTSSKHHSEILYSSYRNPNFQIVSGRESNAYPDVEMHRTVSMLKSPLFNFPVIIDIFRLKSEKQGRVYDLPFYYRGHMIYTNFEYKKETEKLLPLGSANGYQHLWLEARAKPSGDNAVFSWFKGNRFYSITTLTNTNSELLMTRSGAGDPYFFLRQEPAFMIRQRNAGNHTFVSIVEPHGLYDINKEVTEEYSSRLKSVKLLQDDEKLSVVAIHTVSGQTLLYAHVNSNFSETAVRSFYYKGKKIDFTGNYFISEI